MKITKVEPLSMTTVRRLMFLKDWLATLPANAVRFDGHWGQMVGGEPMGSPAGLATQCQMLKREGLFCTTPHHFVPAYKGERHYTSNCWAAIELFFDLRSQVCRVEFEREGAESFDYNVTVLDAIFKDTYFPKAVTTADIVQRIDDILSLNAQFNG